MQSLLTVLTKHSENLFAVDHVSFKVKRGEVFGFLGPNGAGNQPPFECSADFSYRLKERRVLMGLILQNNPTKCKSTYRVHVAALFFVRDLSVEQNINFYGGIYGLEGKHFEERKRWAIEMAGFNR